MEREKPIILIVDDDVTTLRLLQEFLQSEHRVRPAPSGATALAFLNHTIPDLVLLDVEMPDMDGYDVIRAMKSNERWKNIPIIFLTGIEDQEKEETAFNLGAVDYILKPFSVGNVRARIRLHLELEFYRQKLEARVGIRTSQLKRTQAAILNILANMTAFRDNETGAHIKRTTNYSQALVENLIQINHPEYQVEPIYADSIIKSAKLHDIGKVAIPDSILFKPGRLTPEEFDIIKKHTVYGTDILDDAMDDLGDTSYFLSVAREIIIGHHEKWDGSGYPSGIRGSSIPLSARIMAIADVYDALISRRPYKEPFPHEQAVAIILKDAGTHFDPTLIELSKGLMLETFHKIADEYQDDFEKSGM